MAQEIYHRSEWGNPNEQWGNVYLNADLTNELYKRASEYENSWVTDQLLNGVGTKPSIILTPTAYEDGILNSVKPAKTLGSELVTNGTFDTDSNWSKGTGWSISGGKANANNVPNLQRLQQGLGTSVVGKKYKYSLNITNVSGFYSIYIFGVYVLATSNREGLIEGEFTATSTNGAFWAAGASASGLISATIDNVSVKEVIDADFDFTRGSSATRVNELGLVQDVTDTDLPRINYTNFDYENGEVVPYSGEGSLLLEPQSTNLINNSENFSSWSIDDVAIESDSSTSPDGNTKATLIKGNTNSSKHNIRKTLSGTVDASYSIFAKAKELRYLQIASINTANQYVNFDLQDGLVGTVGSDFSNAKIEKYSDGWYRLSVTSDSRYNSFYISLVSGTNATWLESWVMSNSTDGLYIWGAQVEALSYATSYISTNGSTVTRLADVCNNSGSSDLINSTEGVLYAEISALANDGTVRYFGLNDGSNNNRAIFLFDGTANRVRAIVSSGGTKYVDFNYTVTDLTEFHKIALKYKADDFALWIDGTERNTDTSGLTPIGLDNLEFDLNLGGAFYGNVKCLAVFKEALSDTELQKLTTI